MQTLVTVYLALQDVMNARLPHQTAILAILGLTYSAIFVFLNAQILQTGITNFSLFASGVNCLAKNV